MSLHDRKALAAIIAVYDTSALNDRQAERVMQNRADGIVDLATKPIDRLFAGRPVRGLQSVMRMRESCFESPGEMFLFASVLAEFLALYATTNSFHQLEVTGVERNQTWLWPAKPGLQPLI
jgi:type VI secretion system protein ImpG